MEMKHEKVPSRVYIVLTSVMFLNHNSKPLLLVWRWPQGLRASFVVPDCMS